MVAIKLKGDLFGAFSVAVTSIPQSIGYGLIAFALLGPEFSATAATLGVLSAAIGGAAAAATGGTSIQISGPKAPLTMIYAAVVATLVADPALKSDPGATAVVALASVSLCVAAVFQLILGALKIGGIVKYVPHTVVSGFMNGVALLIIASQLGPLLGLEPGTELAQVLAQPDLIRPVPLVVGVVTLATVYVARRAVRLVPGALIALLTGTILHHALERAVPGLDVGALLGAVEMDMSGVGGLIRLPGMLSVPDAAGLLTALAISGLVLGLIASMESLLSAVVCDNLTGERHDSDRELVGQGFANLLCAAVGALPSAGSIPRSVQNYRTGGRTALSGVACGVLVLLIFSMLSKVIGALPLAVIAGLLLSVALDLFDDWTKNLIGKLRTHRGQRREVLVDLAVAALVAMITVSINIVAAVGVGVAIASILVIARMGRSVVRRTYGGDKRHSRKIRSREQMATLATRGASIKVYELQGSIFFGSADRLAADIQGSGAQFRYVILDMQRVMDIDSTGAKILARLGAALRAPEQNLLVSGIDEAQSLWGFLEVMDVIEEIGRAHFFPDTDRALEWAEDHLLASNAPSPSRHDMALADMDIVREMDGQEVTLLQQLLVSETPVRGQRVFRDGDTETDLFIVLAGSVSIRKQLPGGGQSKRLVTFGPGSMFGEMALIERSPRSADAWADTDCELLRLPYSAYLGLCADNPRLANKLLANMASEMSSKLRRTSTSLAALENA